MHSFPSNVYGPTVIQEPYYTTHAQCMLHPDIKREGASIDVKVSRAAEEQVRQTRRPLDEYFHQPCSTQQRAFRLHWPGARLAFPDYQRTSFCTVLSTIIGKWIIRHTHAVFSRNFCNSPRKFAWVLHFLGYLLPHTKYLLDFSTHAWKNSSNTYHSCMYILLQVYLAARTLNLWVSLHLLHNCGTIPDSYMSGMAQI